MRSGGAQREWTRRSEVETMPLQEETIRSVLVFSEIRQDLTMYIIDRPFRREEPKIRVFGAA